MNIIVLPIICLLSLTLAEPPVGDGYPAARSSDHNHNHNDNHNHSDHGRSPSHQYGPPSAARNSISSEYGPPSVTRNSISSEYGPPSATRNSISSEYGAPNARNAASHGEQTHKFAPPSVRVSFNQRFSSAASRRSNPDSSASNVGQGYAAARSGISQTYGPPESRSLSQNYGAPSASTRSLSLNDVSARSAKKPLTPVSRNIQSKSRDQNSLNQDYSKPKYQFSKTPQSDSITTLARSNNAGYESSNSYSDSDAQSPSQTYGSPNNSPSSTYGAPSPSTSYGVPSTRNSDSPSQDYDSVSHSYTATNEGDLSESYGAPNAKSLSQEYGAPSSRSSLKADSVSYASASSRSSPSSSYLPAAREASPSQQYGVPDQDTQGYEQSRARALAELLNQEPANYDFAYQIEDQESGADFGHLETREGNRAEGSYFVVLPDGSKQTVEYEADERGYKPRISVEPPSNGYDENAQDLSRSAQGPY